MRHATIKGPFPIPIPQGGNTTETAPHGLFLCWFHPNKRHLARNTRRKSTFLQEHVTTVISMQH